MHFAQLYSLPLAVALASQALVSAAPNVQLGLNHADTVLIENQRLYITDGLRYEDENKSSYQFLSLDLTTAWTSDAPAWTNHTRRTAFETQHQGLPVLTKDGSSILFFSGTSTYQYNVKTNEWAKDIYKNWTYSAFEGGVVTDTDSGLIYGIESFPTVPTRWKFTQFNPTTKDSSFVEQDGHPNVTAIWRTLVYSKASKTIYSYDDEYLYPEPAPVQFTSYNIASKKWSAVNATGDIPSPRNSPCLVTADGGKRLILAGGLNMTGPNVHDDVYSFDVATSVWSKLAKAPRAAWSPICAVSGDSFIYWGGLARKEKSFNYDEGPAILNIVSNTWGDKYTPPTPVSSADRANAVLSKVGLAALTVVSIAVSSWVL
ncbi:MAG: hypothetical protein J3Q66DRAFT_359774 [Benniella sp.]|nr:MAG: hypothetical protein J3Q66DRAFT_359774 [Benniella sp.]